MSETIEQEGKHRVSGSELSGLVMRTDTERIDWLEKHQKPVYEVIARRRRPTTTAERPHYEEYIEFLGWCVGNRYDELPTIREAIDAAMDDA